jgi:vacuolar protein sorting-associated protein VTA1
MASQLPAALKATELPRFALRAAQLEKVKPVVAYWSLCCVNHTILSLHADKMCR